MEVLPDLSPDFEVIIIDNGSDDNMFDTACSLAMTYPQVEIIRHSRTIGTQKTLDHAIEHSHSEVIFIYDDTAGMDVNEICRLWDLRDAAQSWEALAVNQEGSNSTDCNINSGKHVSRARSNRGNVTMIRKESSGAVPREESPLVGLSLN